MSEEEWNQIVMQNRAKFQAEEARKKEKLAADRLAMRKELERQVNDKKALAAAEKIRTAEQIKRDQELNE